MTHTDSQLIRIKDHLKRGHPITPLGALRTYGCMRLGARIWELRQEGLAIDKTMIEDAATGKRYAQYRLAQ